MAATVAGAAGTKLGYRPGLDGLRAVAVALVIGVHLWPRGVVPGGFVGVDLFFVLSGYLITTLLVAELDASGGVALGRFLGRRMVRLAPAMLLVVAAVMALGLASGVAAVATVLYVADFTSADGMEMGALGPMWSLAIEEQFYLAWALAVPLVWRMRRPVPFLAALVALVVVWRSWLIVTSDAAVYFRPDTRADGLLAGCALAFVLARRDWSPGRLVPVGWAIVVACVLLGLPSLLYPAMTFAGVVLVAQARTAGGVLAHPVLGWIGKRSYGIYLWHYPLYILCYQYLGADAWRVALPLTVLVAAVSYAFVEMPMRLRLRDRLERGGHVRPASAVSCG